MSILEQLSQKRKELITAGSLPSWYTTPGFQLFMEKYHIEGEDYFRGRITNVAKTAAKHLPQEYQKEYEEKFFNLFWNGWLSPSTPVLSNMGTDKGLPVSCSGQVVEDSIDGFYSSLRETAILSKNGFGTAGYLGDIRPRGSKISKGGKSSGVLPVFKMNVQASRDVSQGSTRRGAWAGYLPVSHGDFDELADYVKDKPDDANIGWCWYDSDTEKANAGDIETIRRFKKIMTLKMLTGKGYIIFPDKANRAAPQVYKDRGLEIKTSQLCTEIFLYNLIDETFTCVLSSMNLAKRDEWKDTTAIFDATVFLDCVAQEFINKASSISGLEKAVKFTRQGRALGLGVCGLHTYLQQNMIAFEELRASFINREIFEELDRESLKASQWMAKVLGEPPLLEGYGLRNTHRLAIAPTLSSAALMAGVSQGIEPMIGNCFIQSNSGGEVERINPPFLDLMKKRGKYSKKLVKEIADNYGSVQNLDWLTDEEKIVFRTAFEINQEVILRLASQRQRYIDQGQSLNLFFAADASEKEIARIHKIAIEDENIKSVYYVRSSSGVSAASGGSECIACQ